MLIMHGGMVNVKRCISIILLIVTIVFSLCNCAFRNIDSDASSNSVETIVTSSMIPDTSETIDCISTETKQSETTETKQSETTETKQSETTDPLESWVGVYKFSEFAEPDQNRWYSIDIFKENDLFYAKININGFQTLTRIKAIIEGDKVHIDIVFDKYMPDNIIEIYSAGDLLLKLEKIDNEIYTEWVNLKPMIIKNKERGIYFVPEQ
jgi:hypothetical protein